VSEEKNRTNDENMTMETVEYRIFTQWHQGDWFSCRERSQNWRVVSSGRATGGQR